ncbi:MAG: hypothetical protein KDA96_07740 [Planctomycetaceae bacterium]|nr:hypothetical protein [Planctomycetaceae bacterium]
MAPQNVCAAPQQTMAPMGQYPQQVPQQQMMNPHMPHQQMVNPQMPPLNHSQNHVMPQYPPNVGIINPPVMPGTPRAFEHAGTGNSESSAMKTEIENLKAELIRSQESAEAGDRAFEAVLREMSRMSREVERLHEQMDSMEATTRDQHKADIQNLEDMLKQLEEIERSSVSRRPTTPSAPDSIRTANYSPSSPQLTGRISDKTAQESQADVLPQVDSVP